jgi:hypothetical protein
MGGRGLAALIAIISSSTPVLAYQDIATDQTVEMQAGPPQADCRPVVARAASRILRVGGCVRSILGDGDPTLDGDIPYEDYRLALRRGEAIRIDMDALPPAGQQPNAPDAGFSGAFDTYLEVRRPGAAVPLVENDDRPGPPYSYNSSLIFSPPASGTYVVRARSLGAGAGAYVLRVIAAPAIVTRELRLDGPSMTSRIDTNDPRADGRYYEEYLLPLRAGQVAQIDMEATEEPEVGAVRFDPFLAVYAPNATIPFGMNDDRGDSLNARLIFVAPADDIYVVRAQGLVGTTGNYRIAAMGLPSVPLPDLLAGDHATGTWFNGSPATELDGRPVRYMEYRFEGMAGERVQIDATSNLRPQLRLGRTDRAWFAERAGEGGSARLVAALPETGTYIVRLEVPAPFDGTFDLRLTRMR